MIRHHLFEGGRSLVVGGMRFVDAVPVFNSVLRKLSRLFLVIREHGRIAKFHSWLHHNGDDPLPSGVQAARNECLFGYMERCSEVFDSCGRRRPESELLAAGNGHFSANDVKRSGRASSELPWATK